MREYERRFWLLWKENADLRASVLGKQNQLAASDRGVATVEALAERDAEVLRLRDLVAGYERGRFIHMMRKLREILGM